VSKRITGQSVTTEAREIWHIVPVVSIVAYQYNAVSRSLHRMDFSSVVHKYGEETTRLALRMLVSRIRGVISQRTAAAIDGVLVMTHDQLRADALHVACSLDGFPFSADEKCALIDKAWEIVGP
jgi:hypothetical protein